MKYTSLTHYHNLNVQQDWRSIKEWEDYILKQDHIWSVLLEVETGTVVGRARGEDK